MPNETSNRAFAVGLIGAFGGALIYSLPTFLTVELWYMGFYIDRLRLILLILVMLPVLVGLSHFRGFERTFQWQDNVLDGCVAISVGFITAAVMLPLFSIVRIGMSADEIVGKATILAIPGALGALTARSRFAGHQRDMQRKSRQAGYAGELFFMLVGALFLSLTLAPTLELVLLPQMISWGHSLALVVVTLLVMQAFAHAFHGEEGRSQYALVWRTFFRLTAPGFAIALLVSLYMLWSFSRTEGFALEQLVQSTLVLAFPASIGAAAARAIL